jgi:hypothetical protein
MDILKALKEKSLDIDVALWAEDNDNAVTSVETGCKSVAGHSSTKYLLEKCPFCETEDRAAIFIGEYPSFKRGFSCFHNSCESKKFSDIAEKWSLNALKHCKEAGDDEHDDRQRSEMGLKTKAEVKAYEEARYGSGFEFEALDMDEFRAQEYAFDWLIEGKMIQGQNLIVAGGSKSLKTTVSLDAALALATGTKWLGEFNVPKPRKVLFIAGEGGGAELQRRVLTIEKAMGGRVPAENFFFSITLPIISSNDHLAKLEEFVREKGIEVVFIDPAYLAMMSSNSKASSSNVFEMGAILQGLNARFKDSDVTVVIIHHYKKSSALPTTTGRIADFVPPTLADISQSGFAEFARTWWLLGRVRPFKDGVHSLYLETGGQACGTDSYHLAVDEGVRALDLTGGKWETTLMGWGGHFEHEENEIKKRELERELDEITKAQDVIYRYLINQPDSSVSSVRSATGFKMSTVKEALNQLVQSGTATSDCPRGFDVYNAITQS